MLVKLMIANKELLKWFVLSLYNYIYAFEILVKLTVYRLLP